MESPCIRTCVVDPVSGYCIGCGRTGEEIGGWIGMGPAARRRVMEQLPDRLKAMTTRAVRQRRRTRA